MGIFGISDAIGSISVGKLSDKFGRLPLLIFGCIIHALGIYFLFLFFF